MIKFSSCKDNKILLSEWRDKYYPEEEPQLFIFQRRPYPEEFFGWPGVQRPISDLCLFSKVLSTLNGRNHSLHRQKGSQVGSIWWDNDQSEKPPHSSNYSTWKRPAHKNTQFSFCYHLQNKFLITTAGEHDLKT